jgi:hypothetical protein
MRKLSKFEYMALCALADKIDPSEVRQQVKSDIVNCTVDAVSSNSILKFNIEDYNRAPYSGQRVFFGVDRFPVGGSVKTVKGQEVELWLYADGNNRLLELELNNWSDAPIADIDWSTFRVD